MKFRYHRGGLVESMETIIDVESMDELEMLLKPAYGAESDPKFELECEHYCFDERIGWSTYIVTVNKNAVGFTNGPLFWEEETENEENGDI